MFKNGRFGETDTDTEADDEENFTCKSMEPTPDYLGHWVFCVHAKANFPLPAVFEAASVSLPIASCVLKFARPRTKFKMHAGSAVFPVLCVCTGVGLEKQVGVGLRSAFLTMDVNRSKQRAVPV
jgi:hypothetical protein